MTLANTPQGPAKAPTEKVWRLGESLHHRTVRQFTINKWWHTLLLSLFGMAFGLGFLSPPMIAFLQFPWDNSTFGQKLMVLLFAPLQSFFGIWIFIDAVAAWWAPNTLTFDGNGALILQSLARRRHVVINDIRKVVLAKQNDGESNDDALGIQTKFSNGKLKLCRFAEREKFMNALKAANPTIVVETV